MPTFEDCLEEQVTEMGGVTSQVSTKINKESVFNYSKFATNKNFSMHIVSHIVSCISVIFFCAIAMISVDMLITCY